MMIKLDANGQNTSRYRVSKKKQTRPIYEMVPCYEEAMILGDSLAESTPDFRLLQKHNVVAKRNYCIDSIQGDLLFAISMQPSVIFMEYGKNDMLRSGKDLNTLIACYRRQIQMLQSALSQTVVCINSILPLRRDVMQCNGGEHRHHSCNRVLRDMRDALQLTFIDNSLLMEWEDEVYEYDGIYLKYPYYPKWLRYMAACAGLLPKESDWQGFLCIIYQRGRGSEKEKMQMNLHPTDNGDRNTQDEAKHFHTVGFLF